MRIGRRINLDQVQETMDYNIFGIYNFNRTIKHNKKLSEAIQDTEGNLVPVLLSKSNKIIDGQHRAYICEALNLPVRYIKTDATDEEAAEIIKNVNKATRNFNPQTYAEMNADMGIAGYKYYIGLMEEYDIVWSCVNSLMKLNKKEIEEGIPAEIYPKIIDKINLVGVINSVLKTATNQRLRQRDIIDSIYLLESKLQKRKDRGEKVSPYINYRKVTKSFKHVVNEYGIMDRVPLIAKKISEAIDYSVKEEKRLEIM